MVNRSLVQGRLAKLREYVKILEGLGKYPLSRFKEDSLIHGSAERYLQLAIEVLLDVGNHLIADRELRKPESYQEIFFILGESRIIPKLFARRIAPMAGLRNLLVHDYLAVDLERIHALIRRRLSDFKMFGRYISRLL